jgi:hypothetical protein
VGELCSAVLAIVVAVRAKEAGDDALMFVSNWRVGDWPR